MSILIKGMKMPKDCPMCPMAHYDLGVHFRGCDIVSGKKHAMNDQEYADSDCRPDWCPLIEITTPHGALIDMDDFLSEWSELESYRTAMSLCEIIPPEEGK